MQERQTWTSQLTYILAVAGATVGFGATWRFPYLVGQNGGGAYVLTFCLAMVVIGIPMLLVENAIGRRLHTNSIDSFSGKDVSPAWKAVGVMGLIGAFGIMAYYMVIGGWVLSYIYNVCAGTLNLSHAVTAAQTAALYTDTIENSPWLVGGFTTLFVAVNLVILLNGAVKGIEKTALYLMPCLFILMVVMVIRNVTLPGAWEGIRFYLTPDFSKITSQLFVDVLGQVFFALSLGFGVIITMSSFVKKDANMVYVAMVTGVVNTLIAVAAGFMIFPSLFTFGISPDSGPSLVFKSLPIVFSHMPFGSFFAITFFSLLMLAALTTSLPIYEVIVTALESKYRLSRVRAILYTLLGIFILGNVPCILSTNVWSGVTIFGKSIFDAFDAISATIFFVLTSLLCAIFVGWIIGKEAKAEVTRGSEKYGKWIDVWFFYIKYIVPFVILVVFVNSFRSNFL